MMAPFTIATFPLQSCRMGRLLPFARRRNSRLFGRQGVSVNRNRARLGAAVETNAAAGAFLPGVLRRVNALVTQFSSEFQAFGRARLHAQPAAFALLRINRYVTACFRHRLPLYSVGLNRGRAH